MRFKLFTYEGEIIKDPKKQDEFLEKNNFHWLIDSEIEDAQIEIKNKTLIWHGGKFYSGFWNYGIFKGGEFFGHFENGIIEGGKFHGKFISGINLV